MSDPRLNDNERQVLGFLASVHNEGCYSFAGIGEHTGLDRKVIRRACRSLARKGLTEFHRGLWTEDGAPAGSGYGTSKHGYEVVRPYIAIGLALFCWGSTLNHQAAISTDRTNNTPLRTGWAQGDE